MARRKQLVRGMLGNLGDGRGGLGPSGLVLVLLRGLRLGLFLRLAGVVLLFLFVLVLVGVMLADLVGLLADPVLRPLLDLALAVDADVHAMHRHPLALVLRLLLILR